MSHEMSDLMEGWEEPRYSRRQVAEMDDRLRQRLRIARVIQRTTNNVDRVLCVLEIQETPDGLIIIVA